MIFVHDHTFIAKEDHYYTTGSLNNKLFNRYINWFGDVSVFATKKVWNGSNHANISEQNRVDNVRLHLVEKNNNIITMLKNRRELERTVSQNDFLVARIPSIYGIMAVNYAKRNNIPYLIELVGCPWDTLWNHGWKGKAIAPFMWFATKITAMNSKYVVYVTNEFLQNRYPCKGTFIGCSDVALPTLDESILNNRLCKINKMNLDSGKPVILGTLGAVNVRYKGHEDVIKAISLLNNLGHNFEYHIAGGGSKDYLQSMARKFNVGDKVKFLGSLPHANIFDYLDNIDIYIQPSKTEGLPRALVEALSRGCPSLGSNKGGIPELLDDDFIFKSGSNKEICSILANMNKDIMKNAAKRNFEKAKDYRKEILDEKRSLFYKEFIKSKVTK